VPTAFGKLLDAIAAALGLAPDKPRPKQQQTADAPDRPKSDSGLRLTSFNGLPITPDECRVCGVRPAKPEHYNQFCSYECERRMGDSMDAWHDQFEERFGEGDTYEEWRAELEERHGKDYFDEIKERARKKD
jgi:hypothetical protein